MRHLISTLDITRGEIEALFDHATDLEAKRNDILKDKIIASIFFEPSTRTRFSFESAAHRLGASVISNENAKEFSSIAKGETIEDMMRIMSTYADLIIMRHPDVGSALKASLVATVPIVNAGDGIGEHPTQALLDLYTIHRHRGKIDSMSIAIIGDLKNGRTVKSLLYALSQFRDIDVTLISPESLKLQRYIFNDLQAKGMMLTETENMEGAIKEVDIVYQTRIQKERFEDQKEYERYKGIYKIDKALASTMKEGAFILHPLPRVDEISPEVDSLPQALYFKQASYGVAVRMAILKWLLK